MTTGGASTLFTRIRVRSEEAGGHPDEIQVEPAG